MKNNVTEEGGKLVIKAKKEPQTCGNRTKQITSGFVQTNTMFRYGYFEIKAKVPNGNGFWPAFWLQAQPACLTGGLYEEIDVFEFCGCNCNEFQSGLFYQTFPNLSITHPNDDINVSNSCNAFHTYGVVWTPSKIDIYLDGIKMKSYNNSNITDLLSLENQTWKS